MHMKQQFGWPDRSVTKLLTFLQDFLPDDNHMPDCFYKAKRIICPLGMEVRRIHACKNDCILYCGDAYINLGECPVCKFPRFKVPKGEATDMADDSEDDMDTDRQAKIRRKNQVGRTYRLKCVRTCLLLLV